MCLYSRKMYNKKYTANQKNGGIIPEWTDTRTRTIEIGCGYCYMCKHKKSNEWKIRLYEENKNTLNEQAKFVSLTITDDNIKKLELDARKKHLIQHKKRKDGKPFKKLIGYKLDNAIATLAIRRFLERWRKENKKSVKHWFTTELGQTNTERIHIHGIIWSNKIKTSDKFKKSPYLDKKWLYGNTYVGEYVNEKTMTYISKYITKTDKMHPHYKGKILTTPGIGKNYINPHNAHLKRHEFKYEQTKTTYINRSGVENGLPQYYKQKIWTEEQREWLWMHELNKNTKWVWHEEVNISTPKGIADYHELLKYYRKINTKLGYGGRDTKRELLQQETHKRELLRAERERGYKRRKPLIYIPNNNYTMKNQIKPISPNLAFDQKQKGIKVELPTEPIKDNSKYWGYHKGINPEQKKEIIKELSKKTWEEITNVT